MAQLNGMIVWILMKVLVYLCKQLKTECITNYLIVKPDALQKWMISLKAPTKNSAV